MRDDLNPFILRCKPQPRKRSKSTGIAGALGVFFCLVFFSCPASATELRGKLFARTPGGIAGLKWESDPETRTPLVQGDPSSGQYVVLQGVFSLKDRQLYLEDQSVSRDEQGRFAIELNIDSRARNFTLLAKDPKGNKEKQEFTVLVEQWKDETIQPMRMPAETLESSLSRTQYPTPVQFDQFRFASLFVMSSTLAFNTAIIEWTPHLKFGRSGFSVLTPIGLTALRASTSLFLVPAASLLVGYSFNPKLTLEFGGSLQHWSKGSLSIRKFIQCQLSYGLTTPLFSIIHSIFAGMNVPVDRVSSIQLRAGVQFDF